MHKVTSHHLVPHQAVSYSLSFIATNLRNSPVPVFELIPLTIMDTTKEDTKMNLEQRAFLKRLERFRLNVNGTTKG